MDNAHTTDVSKQRHKNRLRSAQLIPLSFLAAVAIGTLLLMLPFSTASGESTDILTALFTASTSVCVTGLVVVDTFAYWSLFGKIVILILIQLGGLGIITVTSVIMLFMHKKFSLRYTVLLHDSFNLNSMSGLLKFISKVLRGTFIVESAGALLYMIRFIPKFGAARGIWYSVFTSISAFCNAGIDILGPDSLIGYNSDALVMTTTMLLIIFGGLGYVVWFDITDGIKEGIKKKFSPLSICRRLGEHTKLVLTLTLVLIAAGAVGVFLLEYSNPLTIGGMSAGDKVLNSVFQSVTFRTAGFAAVPQQSLNESTCVLGAVWMFIGGSPVGTAGGVKTVTMFAALLNAVSYIRTRKETVVFSRRISEQLIRKATAIITVSFGVFFVMLILLMATNDIGLADGLFEVVSATATVGLTRALTPVLNTAGRVIIIISMYLGRIGPISMALFFTGARSEKNNVRFANGNFFVG